MDYRYKEMVYSPNYYSFSTDDREEWFPNGIFHFNVSRMIRDLGQVDDSQDERPTFLSNVKTEVITVEDVAERFVDAEVLQAEHIQQAELSRPLIFAEVAPDSFNLIDGHHRIAKAKAAKKATLPAFFIPADEAFRYLSSEDEYAKFVYYWNTKVEDACGRPFYRGSFYITPTARKQRMMDGTFIWNELLLCLQESRRIEMYTHGQWFTVFRLNGKIFCGEAEVQTPSMKCKTPFRIREEDVIAGAALFEKWDCDNFSADDLREAKRDIRKKLKHAEIVMAIVRIFSQR